MSGVLKTMLSARIKAVVPTLLALGLLGTAAGLLTFWVAAVKPAPEPDVYALLLIGEGETRLPSDGRPAAGGGDPSAYRRTQVVLLKSRPILQAALRRTGIERLEVVKAQADPERWLGQNVEAVYLENTGVLRVSLREGSPEERAALINAIVDSYMDYLVHEEGNEREIRLAKVVDVLHSSEESLRDMRGALRDLMKSSPLKELSLEPQFLLEELSLHRKELLRVQLAKAGAQARFFQRKGGPGGGDKAPAADLEEEIAALAEQEKLLQESIRRVTTELGVAKELKSKWDELAVVEQSHRELAGRRETYRKELQLGSGPSTRILLHAEAGRKGN
jgi:uncharacterized protein involved in exopolysaccharide biosynthesis